MHTNAPPFWVLSGRKGDDGSSKKWAGFVHYQSNI
jgi:hypothetical protein